MTQQNAAMVEEATAASGSLEEQAAKLAKAVGNFKLSDRHETRATDSDGGTRASPAARRPTTLARRTSVAALSPAKPAQAIRADGARKSERDWEEF